MEEKEKQSKERIEGRKTGRKKSSQVVATLISL